MIGTSTTSAKAKANQPEFTEFGLIDEVTSDLKFGANVILGPGDDAAVFQLQGPAVWSTDTMVENVHFKQVWSTAFDIGRKAIATSVADIEAMGAVGIGVLVGLSVPKTIAKDWVVKFTDGIKAECDKANVSLLGGDLSSGEHIVINVSVMGDLCGSQPVTRSGAQLGDKVAICGDLGLAAAGLAVLSRGFRSPKELVAAQRCPNPPYGEGVKVNGVAHAMIDISDGLLADLGHIATASNVGMNIDSALLPITQTQLVVAEALGRIDPINYVLTGGEDHALAGCFAPDQVPANWRIIGDVIEANGNSEVWVNGKVWETPPGWRHF